MRVLLICTANLCRSPMAATMLEHDLQVQGADAEVESAGLLHEGMPTTREVQKELTNRGLSAEDHRSSLLTAARVAAADVVVGMTREHAREAVALHPEALAKTFPLKDLVRRGEQHRPAPHEPLAAWLARLDETRAPTDLLGWSDADDVADPYGRSQRVHAKAARELEDLTARLAALLAATS